MTEQTHQPERTTDVLMRALKRIFGEELYTEMSDAAKHAACRRSLAVLDTFVSQEFKTGVRFLKRPAVTHEGRIVTSDAHLGVKESE